MDAERTAERGQLAFRPSRSWHGRLLNRALSRIEHGELDVRMGDGSRYLHQGAKSGPKARIMVHRPGRLVWRLATSGGLGLDDAFLAGDWETDELSDFLTLMAANEHCFGRLGEPRLLARIVTGLVHRRRRNTRRGSRRNIAAHYDIGNDFYQEWLDPGMTYSAALFDRQDEDLEQAQQRKYGSILERLDLQAGQHILEIGCGWGGLAEAAARRGARVTGITLSREQLDFARRRIERAGLSHLVRLRLQDYRDVEGQFDHVVSIEMFEAVGRDYWQTFFECLRKRLKPGGRAALQIITMDAEFFERYRLNPDFIQRYIFPGGMLPTVSELRTIVQRLGLDLAETQFHGRHYAATLHRWHERFNMAWHRIQLLGFDERFRRMWRYYLAYCEAGFRTGRIDLMQTALITTPGHEA
ncbi:cyclopropane-fatty-acyl-phospholipid synthase family protein [Methylonatrum kenyense]|uniref:SAM-dependent methyltransferase n=1 Tax=Methylonatrum kenyense TaxID=455253 RepID=UPI0020C05393|nr:cyclopropane-fatty-acyl-phospholipid synthase family protein [Methylonatrum kenyense]MCK8516619.1 cyclopropane-fatty-acyl-phospholipid synthase family protein [Methylonatrum kenyense]